MREDLERVLAAYRDGEGDRGAEEARIWREYGREAAIFVLDLAGFTRGLADFGLLDYLDRVHRLLCLTDPIIAEHGGRTMKHDADNCYAAFETVAGAIAAAERCLDHLGRAGAGASVGIAWGPVLFIGGDFYGYPVNIAAKLGEDVAVADEILIDEAAAAMLSGESRAGFAPRRVAVSGVVFGALARLTERSGRSGG